jgi:hypothetical protein
MASHNPIAKSACVVILSLLGVALLSLLFNGSAAAISTDAGLVAAPWTQPAVQSHLTALASTGAVTDTTVADFQAGTGDCYVAPSAGGDLEGEVILAPTIGVTFTGDALPSGWITGTYSAGGVVTVSDGLVTAVEAYAVVSETYAPSQTLEFSATFSAAAGQHIGLSGPADLGGYPWAIFSTGPLGDQLYARTADLINGEIYSPLGSGYLGVAHRYRIAWTDTSIVYSIDGTVVVTHTAVMVTSSMRPIVSNAGTSDLKVDWLRTSPYAAACTFESRVLDAGASAHWFTVTSANSQPVGTAIGAMETRSGNATPPDTSWSAWSAVDCITITSPNGRYIQYRMPFTSSDTMETPILESVALSFAPASQTPVTRTLTSGWNLLALPLQPASLLTAQGLLDSLNAESTTGNCTEVDQWSASGWVAYVAGLPFDDFAITPGQGYFVACTTGFDWQWQGYPIQTSVPLNLAVGWNLLSVPYPTTYTAQSLLAAITADGGSCSEVDRWGASGWEAYVEGLPFDDFAIAPNQGYFVACSAASTFTP